MNIRQTATFFLSKEPMTLKKLQRLCYYAQAWTLKKTGQRLFEDDLEAWTQGPSVYALYDIYGVHGANRIPMHLKESFEEEVSRLLEFVFNRYGRYSDEELSWLARHETPWTETRRGTEPWETSRKVIHDDLLMQIDETYIDSIISSKIVLPVSFGFKLWDFKLENNEDAISKGDWFQEILSAMAALTGKTKETLEKEGVLRTSDRKMLILNRLGFKFDKAHKEQYTLVELTLEDRACSLFGVFVEDVFHIIWFVSKKYKGPAADIDERVNMALKEERRRRESIKLFELERENRELQSRNRELWDLLDEMTDPKVRMYKQ